MIVEVEIKVNGERYAKIEATTLASANSESSEGHGPNDEYSTWIAANGQGPKFIGIVTACRACGVPALVGKLAEKLEEFGS